MYKGTTLITSGTTDDKGEIMFTDLEPGDYRVREAGGTEDYAVDAPDQFVTLVKDQSEIPTLTFRNDKKRDYRIKKVDAETGAAIPGVVFEIFRDGQSLGQLPPTDANGEVQLEHTEFGTYNVKEVTVPPEYVKSDETFIMEIDKDSQDPFVFTVPNKHKKKLTLKKIDEETGRGNRRTNVRRNVRHLSQQQNRLQNDHKRRNRHRGRGPRHIQGNLEIDTKIYT